MSTLSTTEQANTRSATSNLVWPVNKVRQTFVDFFTERGHTFVTSAPVVPHDDPTLLFTNAGMNQFKEIFLGTADPGTEFGRMRRAVDSQMCIRAGGKHNDLDDVGRDTYHHTFFEMLGNWSFGDYFKKEIINWSWELLTGVYQIAPEQLYVTYFEGDPKNNLEPDYEARDLWLQLLPAERVLPGNAKDNFWEMGDTGPCGPCSEIHYDRIGNRDAACLVNRDDPMVVEIWNLVFIQFERQAGGVLKHLPNKHVDTGMGLERLTSILQHVYSNYDTDVWLPIFDAIQNVTHYPNSYTSLVNEQNIDNNKKNNGNKDVIVAYRVVADHIRCLTAAIGDGAMPDSVGRGFVLRRIIRRAIRYGVQFLNATPGFFSELVNNVVVSLGDFYPHLRDERTVQRIKAVLLDEEQSFARTWETGLKQFNKAVEEAQGRNERQIRGSDAFVLHDRYGFPVDLTCLLAEKANMEVDLDGFNAEMKANQISNGRIAAAKTFLDVHQIEQLKRQGIPQTDDRDKYIWKDAIADILAIFDKQQGKFVEFLEPQEEQKQEEEQLEEKKKTVASKDKGAPETMTSQLQNLQIAHEDGDHSKHHQSQPEKKCKSSKGKNTKDDIKISSGGNSDAVADSDSNNGSTNTSNNSNDTDRYGIILTNTNFYAESGGQIYDTGRIVAAEDAVFNVTKVYNLGGYVVHVGHMAALSTCPVPVSASVSLQVDYNRRLAVAANHTTTHELNWVLRHVLEDAKEDAFMQIHQKGSLVNDELLRFDFSYHTKVSNEDLHKIEQLLNDAIMRDLAVYREEVPLEQATKIHSLRQMFGEKYPDPVSVLAIGTPVTEMLKNPCDAQWRQFAVEFCGGTHLSHLMQAERAVILSEEALMKGVRRMVVVTRNEAARAIAAGRLLEQEFESILREPVGASSVKSLSVLNKKIGDSSVPLLVKNDLRDRIDVAIKQQNCQIKAMAAEMKEKAVQLGKAAGVDYGHSTTTAAAAADADADADNNNDNPFVVVNLENEFGAEREALQSYADSFINTVPTPIGVFVIGHDNDRALAVVQLSPMLTQKSHKLSAVNWIKAAIGKGGGKQNSAQSGVPASMVTEVLAKAKQEAIKMKEALL